MLALPLALALFAATPMPLPAQDAAPAAQQDDESQVDRASNFISAAKPAEAVALLDSLIATQERRRQGDDRQTYCARSPAEALLYSSRAASEKKAAVVLPQTACYSIFLKGFALIDLNRSHEAKAWLERALAMAPSNAQFLGELAEWYKSRRDWVAARRLFQRAVDAAALSPDNRRIFDQTRGMRGLGYILIEEGKFDAAEAIYRECLALDPNDERSKHQLDYIANQRGKKT
ncbi:tetratricopeptide repeat protein [Sphingomonas sp.]|jgi:tetratricopeptide (TPR) repeat protein|uniref:tetratricopeptide repeat protein n=1 Tax=Sphingomonas sp. TaxID=28214 RepID=UPI002E351D85|nr:tetratricopeptide repeat protein [Sphingomonas sp.]HEX4694794.1 tetratricopeptide repeat protein [Sphingomonas sp.]